MSTGGPASEKTLRDEFAGQALPWCLSEFAGNSEDGTQYAPAAYHIAEAMLAEKARREADHSEDTLGKVDHSPDATKMIELQDAKRELLSALEIIHATLSASGTDLTGRSVHTLVGIASTVITKHKGAS